MRHKIRIHDKSSYFKVLIVHPHNLWLTGMINEGNSPVIEGDVCQLHDRILMVSVFPLPRICIKFVLYHKERNINVSRINKMSLVG